MVRTIAGLLILAGVGVNPASGADSLEIGSLPRVQEVARLQYQDGQRRVLRPSDLLWLARMIHAETAGHPSEESAAAMVWTLVQRTAYPGFRGYSLQRLIRSYSQPINPYWMRGGRICGKPGAEKKSTCTPKKLKERDRYVSLPWKRLSKVARSTVLTFAAGKLDNPVPGAIGWLDHRSRVAWNCGPMKRSKLKTCMKDWTADDCCSLSHCRIQRRGRGKTRRQKAFDAKHALKRICMKSGGDVFYGNSSTEFPEFYTLDWDEWHVQVVPRQNQI